MPSLIEQVIFYGVPNPERLKISEILSNNIKVCTLEYYPSPFSQSTDHVSKIDFQMWAYPDGIKIYNQKYQILNDTQPEYTFFKETDLIKAPSKGEPPLESLYSFVLTDYDLNRTYYTCLTWNEKHFVEDDRKSIKNYEDLKANKDVSKIFASSKQQYSLAVPKCSVQTMINNPLLLDINTQLVYVPKAMIVCSKTPCIQLQRSFLKYYYHHMIRANQVKQRKTMKIPKLIEDEFSSMVKNNGYPKAELLFNSKKSETLRESQKKLLKKGLNFGKGPGAITIQTKNLKDFFISSLFSLTLDRKKSHIMTEGGQSIGSKLRCDTVFHLPKVYDIFTQNFNYPENIPSSLLPLPVSQFIQLWKCVLLEKQILIFSNSQYKLIMLCEFLLYLIQPIKWENIYIPLLPMHLDHHVEAPGGYMIGMSRIHMDYMMDKFEMKNKVVVDLQYQTVLEEGGKQVIELPEEIKNYLEGSLKIILQKYEESKANKKGLINYLVLNSHEQNPNKQKVKFKQNFVKFSLEIQKSFFHALVALFNNFIPFVSMKQDGIVSVQTANYLNIFQDSVHKDFMKEISKTMVFIRLCEYHIVECERCAWVQKNIGQLFVYSHDILSHKFVVGDDEINSHTGAEIKESEAQDKKAYAWKIGDLLSSEQKYSQYIEYLFEKNLKQIVHLVTVIECYLLEEENKYKSLLSADHLESMKQLDNFTIPKDFGRSAQRSREEEIESVQYQINSRFAESSRNRRRQTNGDQNEEQIYEQFQKLCKEQKVEKLLVKFIKYIELNYPQMMKKIDSKGEKAQENGANWLGWFWDLLNPPTSNKSKQEKEVKKKLQRKLTIKPASISHVLNLQCLFGETQKHLEESIVTKVELNKNEKPNQQSIDGNLNRQQNHNFLFLTPVQGERPSHTQSDVITRFT